MRVSLIPTLKAMGPLDTLPWPPLAQPAIDLLSP